jgi:formamidopyrimidine-DNA glycosylase
MPELPEVETIKTAIEKAIGNAKVLNVEIRNRRLRELIPEDMESIFTGTSIVSYDRIAKYIIICLNNDFCVIWHMGMSGKVKISDRLAEPDKHDHIIIETSNGFLVYNDPRRFGLFTYCKKKDLSSNKYLSSLGADPVKKNIKTDYLYDILQKKNKTPIKSALLDQSIIAGIGNIYASEILYESKILPTRACNKITKDECAIIIENTQKVLQKAIKAGGSTLRDYKKPDGSLGYFQNMHCVYNKTGQKCPYCTCDINKTGGIKSLNIAGRSTFYCESLQK